MKTMRKQREIKSHVYRLAFSDTTNEQILKAHEQGKMSEMLPCQFIRHLVILGLEQYKAINKEPYHEPHYETKIIQFPGRA